MTSLELAEESIRDCVAAAENHADARIQNVLISRQLRPAGVGDQPRGDGAGRRAGVRRASARCCWPMAAPAASWKAMRSSRARPPPMWWTKRAACAIRSGMFCQRIGVAMHAVAVKPSPLQNLKLAVERCHLNVVGTLFAAYACGLATLTEDEKQLGATVIDMGGGVTSIAVFLEGHLVHADVVPMGGFAGHRRHRPHAGGADRPPPSAPRRCTARRWAIWKAAPMSSRCRRWARRATIPPCACRAPC